MLIWDHEGPSPTQAHREVALGGWDLFFGPLAMRIWARQTLRPADRRISRRLPHLGLIARANSNLAMDFVPHPKEKPMDHGFGLAPCPEVFRAAYDAFEWLIWGPWESDGSGEKA